MGRLDELDLSLKLSRSEQETRLKAGARRLAQLRLHLAGLTSDRILGPPLCVLLEGWDASGKGGAIKRLVAPLDPRHVRVATFAAPTPDEKRHHYLQRFVGALPGWAGWPCSTARGTAACSSSASRTSRSSHSGDAPTTRSARSSRASVTRA